MDAVFLKLLELSITGSLFVFAVVLLRLIFRKAPKWVFCVLWGVVALRLILPFSIESSFSLVPEDLSEHMIASQMAQSYVGDVTYIHEGSQNYQAAVDAGRKPIYNGESAYVVTQTDSLEEPKTVKTAVLPVLSRVWVAGVMIMLGYTLVSYLALRRKVSTATLLQGNVKESEYIESPFVLGLLRPVIYLPYGLEDSDRENVIAHEMAHIRRKDHWWKPIGFLILSVYWFNPVMWLAYILLCRDIEGACDEKVIKKLDKDGIRAYSNALLNCSVHRRSIAACPLAFGEVGVKERIKRVMHYKKPAFWIVLLALIASAVAAVLLLTTPPEEVQQNESTESTQPTESMTDMAVILSLVDEIVYNPAMAASSNPYDYINAAFDKYAKILQYGETAKGYLLTALEESDDNGLREYIIAAVCAELTDFGLNKTGTPWGSGKEWLSLYQEHLARLEEPVGTPEDEKGSLIEVGSLLGVDSAWMRVVAVMDHPNRLDLHRYSYRFQYYDEKGQEWYLVEIQACLGYKIGDYDGDGVNELFYFTDTQDYPYYICDIVDGNLVEVCYTLVPDSVLDFDLLLDREGLYLYEERWAWFLKDPAAYVAEVAKRPEDRLYFICPSGIIPEKFDLALIENAYQKLTDWLSNPRTTYEKQIGYKIMTAMEYTYVPEIIPGQINYTMLFEKWGFTAMPSTEERNCYDQILACFEVDPVGFLRGMTQPAGATWCKDLFFVADKLAQVNCAYDRSAYEQVLNRLENIASTDEEKASVELLRESYEAWEVPKLDVNTLANRSGTELWNAFFYDPDETLRVLGSCKEEQLKYLGQKLWGPEQWEKKLLDKGYAAVNGVLAEKPAGTLKDVAYEFLVQLEWQGGYRDTYVTGIAFDYGRLFEKSRYADGALATMCFDQMFDVFEADPESFMKALSQGNWNTEIIAMQFAHRYQTDAEYLEILNSLLENPDTAESARAFIEASENLKKE